MQEVKEYCDEMARRHFLSMRYVTVRLVGDNAVVVRESPDQRINPLVAFVPSGEDEAESVTVRDLYERCYMFSPKGFIVPGAKADPKPSKSRAVV
uniref:Pyridoxamine 5'-phosphate oxidase family protein n=1 Tax=Panagrellus redivivus TaxID=6233 RepID=A0A7E4V347_PANRE